MGNLLSYFKQFDLYRKVPRDLSEPTVSGAVVSMACALIMTALLVSEFRAFISVHIESHMLIDDSPGEGSLLQVNFDATIHRLPCQILTLDTTDVMGSHHVDLHKRIQKHRLSKTGEPLGTSDIHVIEDPLPGATGSDDHIRKAYNYSPEELDKLRKMVAAGEGCRLKGVASVNMVPGNIHVSTHTHAHLLGDLFKEWGRMDIGHRINHMSFGLDDDIAAVKSEFSDTGIVSPLDNSSKKVPEHHSDPIIFEYYLKVVPTIYKNLSGKERRIFQFTANSNILSTSQIPSIYFRYDVSPVTVLYTETRASFWHFAVEICASIAGVFTVAGILDAIIHKSVVTLAKKAQIGKLG